MWSVCFTNTNYYSQSTNRNKKGQHSDTNGCAMFSTVDSMILCGIGDILMQSHDVVVIMNTWDDKPLN